MDAQLEATYEGPNGAAATATITMTNEHSGPVPRLTAEMRVASTNPGSGACTLASAMQMWL
jgi:hypothetical protein